MRGRRRADDPDQVVFSYAVGPDPTLRFDAESVTSDAGLAAVRELDERIGLTAMAARLVEDLRDPNLVVHPVVVTNPRRSDRRVWRFYEHRGQCEQRIDELKNQLRAEKFSCCEFAANAVKLHLIAMAHNLLAAVRIMLPEHHELKRATIGRLRVALIKCGATVVRTARRLWIHASRTWPNRRFLSDVARRFTNHRLSATPLWKSG
jgi:8-oxo-dGTP pyrophosphatase MutT (NUDIX family)